MFARKTFPHGVHPPEFKEETCHAAIRRFAFAPLLFVPLQQHSGAPALPVVRVGQEVARGQLLGRADGERSVPVHAPASGVVKEIALKPVVSGAMVNTVVLEPFPGSTQEVAEGVPCDVDAATPEQILRAIQDAGIVGLGGAMYPTHLKLRVPPEHAIDVLILNGAECEPYLTTDHRVMLEQAPDVMVGMRYILKTIRAPRAIIAVEANKQDAADVLRAAIPPDLPAQVSVVQAKYPQGAERMLIRALLGREVPSGGHAYVVGVVSVNVATAAEIGRLLPHGRAIIERVITLGGPAVTHKGNYRVPVGTPVRYALQQVGVRDDVTEVFLGGPMMGAAVADLDVPITKGIAGVIAFGARDGVGARGASACIRCGACVAACPMNLLPAELAALARAGAYERMAQLNLRDCFECGCCAYVCPAHIPLTQMFRAAKSALRRGA
jgi:electron transport complex protein RnfC